MNLLSLLNTLFCILKQPFKSNRKQTFFIEIDNFSRSFYVDMSIQIQKLQNVKTNVDDTYW